MADKRKLHQEQKLKSFLILNWMKKNTDRFHTLNADKIAAAIEVDYGVPAERRSVYRDIDAINVAVLIANGDAANYEEALEFVENGTQTIVYDASKKGYYYDNVYCSFDEIKLAAEAIYASKFIDKETADKIVEEILCKEVSSYQSKEIKNDIFVSDRTRTTNKHLWHTIQVIREAMLKRDEDDSDDIKKYKHEPENISFQYLTHSLGKGDNQIERGRGAEYVVSPFKLLFSDGNYYLLAYNAKAKRNKVRTYRVDRMRNVKRVKGSEREGFEEIKQIDLSTYTKTHFNMFEGDSELVTIRFTNDLLDSVYERFGNRGAQYAEYDKKHFTITTRIHLSNPFYGWVFGFGKKAKIIKPQKAIDEMAKMIESISGMYKTEETE